MAQGMRYASIENILVAQVNILNKVPAFWHQQNTSFMSLVTKLASGTVKEEKYIVVKNPYFKLPANNITLSTFEKFSLKRIESNIKADILFLYSPIRKASGVKKVNAANSDKNISTTTLLVIKNKEHCQF